MPYTSPVSVLPTGSRVATPFAARARNNSLQARTVPPPPGARAYRALRYCHRSVVPRWEQYMKPQRPPGLKPPSQELPSEKSLCTSGCTLTLCPSSLAIRTFGIFSMLCARRPFERNTVTPVAVVADIKKNAPPESLSKTRVFEKIQPGQKVRAENAVTSLKTHS